jgi:carbon monoxide dehydrogenase subunit G
MIVEAQVTIAGSKQVVWDRITDIEHAAETISGIEKLEVLHKPASGIVGLKWRETRTMFGKSATEVMWITEAAEQQHYKTRAESHGCVYECTFRLAGQGGDTRLTMTFESTPRSFAAKLFSPLMAAFKGALKKQLQKDLDDIKSAVEQRRA